MDLYAVKEPHRCGGCGKWLLGGQICTVCKLLSDVQEKNVSPER